MDNFDTTKYFRNQYLNEAGISTDPTLYDRLTAAVGEDTTVDDFALTVAEVLKEQYGSHNYEGFMEVLHRVQRFLI